MDDQCLSEAKTDRVLAIYSRLVGGAVLNKADLAQQFHVTQRSIQRDIESLRCFFAEQELPQDIVYDKRSRGYRLIDNAQKKLSNSEVLAVCKILLESRSMVTDEMMPLLDRLIDCCVPEQNKAIVQSLVANERFHYVPPHHGKRLLNGLWEIGQAVRNHQAMEIQYDTIADAKYHWKATNWKTRTLVGLRERIVTGDVKDTVILMEPTDLVYSKGQQETFTSPELLDYISKQTSRGSGNVVQYEVEFHKRIAMSFSSFILTIIGLSLSARKRKGGMGLYLGIGLGLSFGYIMLQTVSSTFAINAGTPPVLAAWIPNLIFAFIAYFCYRHAPR